MITSASHPVEHDFFSLQQCSEGGCRGVCNSPSCLQLCNSGNCSLECNGLQCRQNCTAGGCNLSCPEEAEVCEQDCPAQNCTITKKQMLVIIGKLTLKTSSGNHGIKYDGVETANTSARFSHSFICLVVNIMISLIY